MSVSVDRSPDGGETGSIPVRETPGSTPGTDTYSADSSELKSNEPALATVTVRGCRLSLDAENRFFLNPERLLIAWSFFFFYLVEHQ